MKASKVIQNVESNKEQYIVVKNNKPQAIIMSIEEYSDLQNLREEYELMKLATQRVAESNDAEYSSFDEVMKEFDIDEDEIDKIEDSVDMRKLDNSLKKQVLAGIRKVSRNPLPQSEDGYGKALGNI